jgi:hypothetical protein
MIMTSETKKGISLVYRECGIALIADDLVTSALKPEWFDVGVPTQVVQTPEISYLDYGNSNIFVHGGTRRAVARDSSPDLVATSPIALMMDKLVRELGINKVTALGFNYTYEAVFPENSRDMLTERYFNQAILRSLGDNAEAAGFRLILDQGECSLRVTVDRAVKNPFALNIILNYNYDDPPPQVYKDIINRFGQHTATAPGLAEKVTHVE